MRLMSALQDSVRLASMPARGRPRRYAARAPRDAPAAVPSPLGLCPSSPPPPVCARQPSRYRLCGAAMAAVLGHRAHACSGNSLLKQCSMLCSYRRDLKEVLGRVASLVVLTLRQLEIVRSTLLLSSSRRPSPRPASHFAHTVSIKPNTTMCIRNQLHGASDRTRYI